MKGLFFTIAISILFSSSVIGQEPDLKEDQLRTGMQFEITENGEQNLHFTLPANKQYRFQIEQTTAFLFVSVFDAEQRALKRLVSTNESEGPIIFTLEGEKEDKRLRINVKARDFIKDHTKASFRIKLLENFLLDEATQDKVTWQSQSATSLQKNDSYHFESIGDAIGDARVVFLGEATHTEAEMTTIKIELIKWLQQNKGFHHLAFESDMFAAKKLQETLASDSYERLLWSLSIQLIWSITEPFSELISYVESTQKEENKLNIYGFDTLRNHTTRKFFIEDVKLFFEKNKIKASEAFYQTTMQLIQNKKKILEKVTEEQKANYYLEFDKILEQVNQLDQSKENRFWSRCLTFVRDNAFYIKLMLSTTPEEKRARDRLMADNLLWLLNEIPKDQKVIVWAASTHIARNLSKQKSLHKSIDFSKNIRLGDYFTAKTTDTYYSLGLTAYQGSFGWVDYQPGTDPDSLEHIIQVDQHEDVELEELFNLANFNIGFLNMKPFANTTHWINQPLVGRIFGNSAIKATWPDVFDGMLFIKEVSPTTMATWAQEEERKYRAKLAKDKKEKEAKEQQEKQD